MAGSRPLLTLAIPTFNRSPFLTELLNCLLPQFTGEQRAELIVSDNASTDDTEAVVASYAGRGLAVRYIRNAENIGADRNFLQCLDLASGKYVWVMGHDDLVAPGAIASILSLIEQQEYDLIYLSSVGFSGDQRPAPRHDYLGRFAEIVTDGEYFLEKVNALIGLISVNIINKDRLLASTHPDIAELCESNLIQVGWLFPVIHRRCRVLYIFERLVFYRHFNSGGWGICEVFGLRLHTIARRYFADEPSLAESLMNGVLRYWLPDVIVDMRRGHQQSMHAEDFAQTLQPLFKSNWRYWLFVYLVAVPPLPVARALHFLNTRINRITRAAQGIRRHIFSRKSELHPRL